MRQSISNKPNRVWVPALDGLRLWASVNIVLFHMTVMGAFRNVKAGDWWLVWIKAPALHASLFFLLGGFLYYLKFSRKHSQESFQASFSSGNFVFDRLRRLYPLHFLTTVLMALFVYSIPPDNWGEALRSVGMHLGLLWSLWPFDTHTLNQPSWAISAFFIAYLFFGPVFVRVRQLSVRGVRIWAGALVGVLLIWSLLFVSGDFTTERYNFFHVFGPVRALEFYGGMLLARWMELRPAHSPKSSFSSANTTPGVLTRSYWHRSGTALTILILIIGSSAFIYGTDWHLRWLHYHNFLPIAFAALIWICAQGKSLPERFFALKWLRPAGQASFAPYLLHVPVLSIYSWYMAKYEHKYEVFSSPVAIVGALVALYGTATAARMVSNWYHSRRHQNDRG